MGIYVRYYLGLKSRAKYIDTLIKSITLSQPKQQQKHCTLNDYLHDPFQIH